VGSDVPGHADRHRGERHLKVLATRRAVPVADDQYDAEDGHCERCVFSMAMAATRKPKNHPHRRRRAKYQANRNGVITIASGWKLTRATNRVGVSSR
jgi:hypothetical protein